MTATAIALAAPSPAWAGSKAAVTPDGGFDSVVTIDQVGMNGANYGSAKVDQRGIDNTLQITQSSDARSPGYSLEG